MPVQNGQIVTLEDLNFLAYVANTKEVVGFPYEFPGPVSISNEFQRLQLNLFTYHYAFFGDGNPATYLPFYPLTRQALVSGPWTITPLALVPGVGTITSASLQPNDYNVYGFPPTYAEPKFVFVGQDGRIDTRVSLVESGTRFYPLFPTNPLYTRTPTVGPKLFRFKFNTNGDEFLLRFQVVTRATTNTFFNTLQLFGASAGDCNLTSELIGVNLFQSVISCTKFVNGEFVFEVGIRDSGTTNVNEINIVGGSDFFCYLEHSSVSVGSFPVLSTTEFGKSIACPDMSALAVLHPDQSIDEPYESDGNFYIGNQAYISMFPRTVGGTSFERRGVWRAKTFPWGKSNSYEGLVNAAAKSPTIAGDDFPPVSRACDYLRPSYPVTRDTDTDFQIYFPDLTGAMLRQFSARRIAVPNADGIDLPPTEKPAIEFQFGVKIGPIFYPFNTYLIPEGEDSLTQNIFYIANTLFTDQLSQTKLVYRCAEKLDIQAVFCTGTSANKGNNSGSLILDFNGGVGPGLFVEANPIQSFHYNDMEALLLAL